MTWRGLACPGGFVNRSAVSEGSCSGGCRVSPSVPPPPPSPGWVCAQPRPSSASGHSLFGLPAPSARKLSFQPVFSRLRLHGTQTSGWNVNKTSRCFFFLIAGALAEPAIVGYRGRAVWSPGPRGGWGGRHPPYQGAGHFSLTERSEWAKTARHPWGEGAGNWIVVLVWAGWRVWELGGGGRRGVETSWCRSVGRRVDIKSLLKFTINKDFLSLRILHHCHPAVQSISVTQCLDSLQPHGL